jgi:hypothetical protein
MRVRAALDSGARLWHLLVVKNLALTVLIAPLGFLLSALFAWRAGDVSAFFKACVRADVQAPSSSSSSPSSCPTRSATWSTSC